MQSIPFEPHKSARFADDALKKSVGAMEQAQRCSVLWFGEIMWRRLYRKLGYSSINQYARLELKFCKTRTGDFVQLARKLEHLPAVRESVDKGELGYTKAREVIKVATPETEEGWVAAAQGSSRRELEQKVAVARKRAVANPDQAELLPASNDLKVPPTSPPVRLTVEMTPEQFALYETLLERLHKQGPAVGGRAEMLLEAMAELAAARAKTTGSKAPRGALAAGPPFQVHIHQCPDCGKATVQTSKGELPVGQAVMERALCDGQVDGQVDDPVDEPVDKQVDHRWTNQENPTPPPSRRPPAGRSWPGIGTVAGRPGVSTPDSWKCITSRHEQMEAATNPGT